MSELNLDLDVDGLEEAIRKMSQYPKRMDAEMSERMFASLDVLWENVPPYAAKPADSTYRRTGTLGKSLGVTQSGGKAGQPTVYGVSQKLGGREYQGKFGTSLSYAKYVIDPEKQAYMHQGRWWTMRDVMKAAEKKVQEIWRRMVKTIFG